MITRESYREALQKAVNLKGADFVYKKPEGMATCRYMEGSAPSCIHAHALFELGHKDLVQYEALSVSVPLHEFGVDDEELVRAAQRAQFVQDNGGTWGEALEKFDSQLENPVDMSKW